MPFVKWTIEPVHVSRTPLPHNKDINDELEAVVDLTLVGLLRQLASLVDVAQRVFVDVGSEFKLVYKRTEILRNKIEQCVQIVETLNAKAVAIPVADVSSVSQLKDQFTTTYQIDCELFTTDTRPIWVQNLYNVAAATPVPILRSTDHYRGDGRTGSKIFLCMPVLGDDHKKYDLEIETRRPASMFVSRDWQDEEDVSVSSNDIKPSNHASTTLEMNRLPSPEERAHALSTDYPSSVVPIDVTEVGFTRMATFRRSLIHADFVIKRKKKRRNKRRNTISEGSSKELQEVLQQSSEKQENYIDSSCQTEDEGTFCKSSKISVLKKSFKKERTSPKEENNNVPAKEEPAIRKKDRWSGLYESMELKLTKDWKLGKRSKKSGEAASSDKDSESFPNKKGSGKGKGKGFLPISTLSAAMTVAVRLRETSRPGEKRPEEGQSSSGNWSGSSSTRASVDLEQQRSLVLVGRTNTPSESSVGKDSVLSETPQDTDGRSQDGNLTGYTSDTSAAATAATAPSSWRPAISRKLGVQNTEAWLKASTLRPYYFSDCNGTPPWIQSPKLKHCHVAGRENVDDGECSVYSVDTDGYFTSMHTDSGLKSQYGYSGRNAESRAEESLIYMKRGHSQSSVSTVGDGSLNSLLSKTATELSSNSSTLTKQKKCPPPPPPRLFSTLSSQVNHLEPADGHTRKTKIVPDKKNITINSDVSASESDQDARERLWKKTAINSNSYPSMCAVSPDVSEDEQNKTRTNFKETGKSKKGLEKNMYVSNETQTPEEIDSLIINMYGDQTPIKSNFMKVVGSHDNHSVHLLSPSFCERSLKFSSFSSVELSPRHTPENSNSYNTIPNTAESFTSKIFSSKSSLEVPDKYAHQIRVTPIPRNSEETHTESNFPATSFCCSPPTNVPAYSSNSKLLAQTINPKGSSSYTSQFSVSSDHFDRESKKNVTQEHTSTLSNSIKCGSDNSNTSTPAVPPSANRPVARVTLDPDGKVIFSSNSLGRLRDGHPMKYVEPQSPTLSNRRGYSTLPVKQTSLPVTSQNGSVKILKDYNTLIPASSPLESANSSRCSTPCSVVSLPDFGAHWHSVQQQKPSFSDSSYNTRYKITRSNSTTPVLQNRQTFITMNSGATYQDIRTGFQNSQSAAVSTGLQNGKNSKRIDGNKADHSTFESIRGYYRSRSAEKQNHQFDSRLNKPQMKHIQNLDFQTLYEGSTQTRNDHHLSEKSQYENQYVSPVSSHLTTAISVQNPIGVFTNCEKDRTFMPFIQGLDVIRSPKSPGYCTTKSLPCETENLVQQSSLHNFASSNEVLHVEPSPEKSSLKSSTVGLSPGSEYKKTMSPAELYAVIHSSKKKHNIKSDVDTSSPYSSGSNSPCSRPLTPTRSVLAETGFLGRRYSQSAGDRRSWAGMENTSPFCAGDRRSLATDRLGPRRPTSMHDFKMLLLQTRSSTQVGSERKSAAELLKVSTPQRSPNSTSPKSAPTSPNSISPTQEAHSYQQPNINGHSTVPLKRGSRARSSLQPRYDLLYPPIIEDCSEENECLMDYQTKSMTVSTRSQTLNGVDSPQDMQNGSWKDCKIEARRPAASTWV